MSDTERAAAICFELSPKFAEAANSGRGHERIDELNAAFERAVREVGRISTGPDGGAPGVAAK